MKICGCVMAKNEELLLPECLNSLKQLTDIIIVVNNGSSDNTEKVAEEFGCILIDSPDTIVDEGRNEYINMANALGADWIFILDADERITSADAKLMRQACENAAMDVYHFRLQWYQYMGKGRFVEIHTPSRLVRTNLCIKYDGSRIHSSLGQSANKLGGKCPGLHCSIHHLDMLYSGRTQKKRGIYIRGLEKQISNTPGVDLHSRSMYMNFLGCEYVAIGDYKNAIQIFNDIILLLHNKFDYKGLSYAYLYLSQLYLLQGEIKNAKKNVEHVITNNLETIDRAYSVLAQISLDESNINDAYKFCQYALQHNPSDIYPLLNIGSLLQENDPVIALSYFNKAISLNPYLLEPIVFKNGEIANPYVFQCLLLSSYTNIFAHLEYCYKMIGDSIKSNYWACRYKEILENDINPA